MKSKITAVIAMVVIISLIAIPGISFATTSGANGFYADEYEILEGANPTWKQGSVDGLVFVTNGEYKEFVSVKIDKVVITVDFYTVSEGSTIINLSENFLKRQELGEHDIEIIFANGKAETTYTIVKPDRVVAPEWVNPFTDISTTDWYFEDVKYVYEKGIMEGTQTNTFSPNDVVTRATIITTLWKMEGKPVANYAMTYTDVDQDKWYSEAIRWASSEKIVNGYDDGSFGIDKHVTREELATMLYRYVQSKGNGFKDSWVFLLDVADRENISEWAYEAVCWMNMNEIINGKDNNMFDPQGNAHRYELAAVLHRFDIKS